MAQYVIRFYIVCEFCAPTVLQLFALIPLELCYYYCGRFSMVLLLLVRIVRVHYVEFFLLLYQRAATLEKRGNETFRTF